MVSKNLIVQYIKFQWKNFVQYHGEQEVLWSVNWVKRLTRI